MPGIRINPKIQLQMLELLKDNKYSMCEVAEMLHLREHTVTNRVLRLRHDLPMLRANRIFMNQIDVLIEESPRIKAFLQEPTDPRVKKIADDEDFAEKIKKFK
jgi:hypothetical protein